MPFTPTETYPEDTSEHRLGTAMYAGRQLQSAFGKASLLVIPAPSGDAFGVLDFESAAVVDDAIVTATRGHLQARGYDSDVIALPGGRGCSHVEWPKAEEFKIVFKLN